MIYQSQEQSPKYNGTLYISQYINTIPMENTFNTIRIDLTNQEQTTIDKWKNTKFICKKLIIPFLLAEYVYQILEFIEVIDELEISLCLNNPFSFSNNCMFLNISNIKAQKLTIKYMYHMLVNHQRLFLSISSNINNIIVDTDNNTTDDFNIFLLGQCQEANISTIYSTPNDQIITYNLKNTNIEATNIKSITEDELNQFIQEYMNPDSKLYCQDLWNNSIEKNSTQYTIPKIELIKQPDTKQTNNPLYTITIFLIIIAVYNVDFSQNDTQFQDDEEFII